MSSPSWTARRDGKVTFAGECIVKGSVNDDRAPILETSQFFVRKLEVLERAKKLDRQGTAVFLRDANAPQRGGWCGVVERVDNGYMEIYIPPQYGLNEQEFHVAMPNVECNVYCIKHTDLACFACALEFACATDNAKSGCRIKNNEFDDIPPFDTT